MCLHVNELPDLCLIAILDRLPADDLLRAKQVCGRWAVLQKAAIRKRVTLRIDNLDLTSLVPMDEIDFFGIDIAYDVSARFRNVGAELRPTTEQSYSYPLSINNETILMLSRAFPFIKTLVVINHSDTLDMTALLSYWPQVTCLKLIGDYEWSALRTPLDRLNSLRHLSVDTSVDQLNDLPVVARLETFNCRLGQKHCTVNEPKMRQLSTILNGLITAKGAIQQFGIWVEDHTNRFDLWSPEVASRVTRLTIKLDSMPLLEWICINMTSLNYLDLEFVQKQRNPQILGIISALSRLKHLTDLKLDITEEQEDISDEELNEVSIVDVSKQEYSPLPQLIALKQVELKFPLDPHQIGSIETIFPNLCEFKLRINSCRYQAFYELLCLCCPNCSQIGTKLRSCQEDEIDSVLFHFKSGQIEKTLVYFEYLDY